MKNSSNPQRARTATVVRKTRETDIEVKIDLDPSTAPTPDAASSNPATPKIASGIPFLDHMLENFCKHSGIWLELAASGDLAVDDHHTVEDCALTLGQAIDMALGDRSGITRFGSAYAPLDEALARVVIDFSGRAWCEADLGLRRESIGGWSCENVAHFFQSLAAASRSCWHVDVIRGDNDHHRIEATFKAAALAFRDAVRQSNTSTSATIPSTKGVL